MLRHQCPWGTFAFFVALCAQLAAAQGPTSADFTALTGALDRSVASTNRLVDVTSNSSRVVSDSVDKIGNITALMTASNDRNVDKLTSTAQNLQGTMDNSMKRMEETVEKLASALAGVTQVGQDVSRTAVTVVDRVEPRIGDVTATVRTLFTSAEALFDKVNTALNLILIIVSAWVVIIALACVCGGTRRFADWKREQTPEKQPLKGQVGSVMWRV